MEIWRDDWTNGICGHPTDQKCCALLVTMQLVCQYRPVGPRGWCPKAHIFYHILPHNTTKYHIFTTFFSIAGYRIFPPTPQGNKCPMVATNSLPPPPPLWPPQPSLALLSKVLRSNISV